MLQFKRCVRLGQRAVLALDCCPDGTQVRKNALNCVRVSWLLSGVPAAVECKLLSISCFLTIGCVAFSTLKCVTACVIGAYLSGSMGEW